MSSLATPLPHETWVARNMVRPLLRPGVWVVLAALVRLGMLVSLPYTGATAAINPKVGTPWMERVGHVSGLVEFLQHRVLYRALAEDEICYHEMGQNIVAGRGFVLDRQWQITEPGKPALYAGCGYPLFVGIVYGIFGSGQQLPVYLIQIAMHALAAALIFQTVRRLVGPVGGAVAAAYYTFHPMLIWSSVALMSEALVIPLAVVFFWLLAHRGALGYAPGRHWLRVVLLGLVMGVLCETRSTFVYFNVVLMALLLLEVRNRDWWPTRLARPLVYFLVFATVCAPWTVRNYLHYHRFIPFSTKKGGAAYVFNHSGLVVEFGPRAVGGTPPVDLYGEEMVSLHDEVARDDRCLELFYQFLREQPHKFLGLTWIRFWMALLPVAITAASPLANVMAWYIKGPMLVLIPMGLYWAKRRLWWRMLPWLLFVSYWQALQSISGAGMRYRLPADPAWVCIVGSLVAVGMARWRPHVHALLLARRFDRQAPATR
ncbi:MAG TPA: glycosyltransferase family 39 protein [Gemmataceae bacterium]